MAVEKKALDKLQKSVGKVTDITSLSSTSGNDALKNPGDFLTFLKDELLRRPALTLLKEYLLACNGNKMTQENCLAAFREKHPAAFRTCFCVDSGVYAFYLFVVVFVALRGLGIIKY